MTLSSIETEVEFEMYKNLKPSTQAKVKTYIWRYHHLKQKSNLRCTKIKIPAPKQRSEPTYDVIINWNRSRIWDVQKLKTKHPNKGQNLHMTLSSIETEVEFALASSTLNLFYCSMISEWSTIVYYKKYIDLLTETHCTSIVVNGCPRNLIK